MFQTKNKLSTVAVLSELLNQMQRKSGYVYSKSKINMEIMARLVAAAIRTPFEYPASNRLLKVHNLREVSVFFMYPVDLDTFYPSYGIGLCMYVL